MASEYPLQYLHCLPAKCQSLTVDSRSAKADAIYHLSVCIINSKADSSSSYLLLLFIPIFSPIFFSLCFSIFISRASKVFAF